KLGIERQRAEIEADAFDHEVLLAHSIRHIACAKVYNPSPENHGLGCMPQLQSAAGGGALFVIASVIRGKSRSVGGRQAAIGLALTVGVAVLFLKVPQVTAAFAVVNRAVGAIADATKAGTSFVFGYLGGGPLPYDLKVPGADFVLALQALPILLVMSAL